MLLVGELLSGLWQEDFHLRLNEGDTKNYAESYRDHELAIIDTTDPKFDDVVTIPEGLFAKHAAGAAPEVALPRGDQGLLSQLVSPDAPGQRSGFPRDGRPRS